jgi:hypothetical protein
MGGSHSDRKIQVANCGAGIGVPGPNPNGPPEDIGTTTEGPDWKIITVGLNVHINANGKNDICTQAGIGKFDISRQYKSFKCPALNICVPSVDAITDFTFFKCKAIIKGELSSGENVFREHVFKHYGRFSGPLVQYAWLEITTERL